jgi:hypothetical protein
MSRIVGQSKRCTAIRNLRDDLYASSRLKPGSMELTKILRPRQAIGLYKISKHAPICLDGCVFSLLLPLLRESNRECRAVGAPERG